MDAIAGRWQENVTESAKFACGIVPGLSPDVVGESMGWQTRASAGRCSSQAESAIARSSTVSADLLADDIFCLAGGPALLDCLEFDDRLRYVDVVDDAAFLAMDLEFLGRPDLGECFSSGTEGFLGRRFTGVAARLLHLRTARSCVRRWIASANNGEMPMPPHVRNVILRSRIGI